MTELPALLPVTECRRAGSARTGLSVYQRLYEEALMRRIISKRVYLILQ